MFLPVAKAFIMLTFFFRSLGVTPQNSLKRSKTLLTLLIVVPVSFTSNTGA